MISQNILNILNENTQFNDFIRNVEDFEVLVKKLTKDDISRLSSEYPSLIVQKETNISKSISSITIIKNSPEVKNHFKLKKLKIYVDEHNEKILKILQN